MIYVLLINKSSFMRRIIGQILEVEKNIRVFKQANNTSSANAILDILYQEIDVVILDTHLGDSQPMGMVYATYLRKKFPGLKILMLSFQRSGACIFQMNQLGVQGFLFMDSHSKEIVKAINIIFEGRKYYSISAKRCLEKYLTYLKANEEERIYLTPTEVEYLQKITAMDPTNMNLEPGTSSNIEESIWRNITHKMQTNELEAVIEIACGLGYLP